MTVSTPGERWCSVFPALALALLFLFFSPRLLFWPLNATLVADVCALPPPLCQAFVPGGRAACLCGARLALSSLAPLFAQVFSPQVLVQALPVETAAVSGSAFLGFPPAPSVGVSAPVPLLSRVSLASFRFHAVVPSVAPSTPLALSRSSPLSTAFAARARRAEDLRECRWSTCFPAAHALHR